MNIQFYGYLHNHGSIQQVTAAWIDIFSKHFNVKFHDYSSSQCSDPKYTTILGQHDPIARVAFYFGMPSLIKYSEDLFKKHKLKIGVYVSELDLSAIEKGYLNNINHNLIIVPSHHCETIFRKAITIPTEIMVVHHGINSDYFFDCDAKKRQKFTFLYIFNNSPMGGTHRRKNLEELIKAFRTLRTTDKEVELYIKTTSNIEEDLNEIRKVEGITIDLCYYHEEEMRRLYNSCHIYINPTRAEGFGICPLEAMACGVPIVSPLHTGLLEYLSPENCTVMNHKAGKESFRHAANYGFLNDITAQYIYESMANAMHNYGVLKNRAIMQANSFRDRFQWNIVLAEIINKIKRYGA